MLYQIRDFRKFRKKIGIFENFDQTHDLFKISTKIEGFFF